MLIGFDPARVSARRQPGPLRIKFGEAVVTPLRQAESRKRVNIDVRIMSLVIFVLIVSLHINSVSLFQRPLCRFHCDERETEKPFSFCRPRSPTRRSSPFPSPGKGMALLSCPAESRGAILILP